MRKRVDLVTTAYGIQPVVRTPSRNIEMSEPEEVVPISPEGLKGKKSEVDRKKIKAWRSAAAAHINLMMEQWIHDKSKTVGLIGGYTELQRRDLDRNRVIAISHRALMNRIHKGTPSGSDQDKISAVKSVIFDYRQKGWDVEEFKVAEGAKRPALYLFWLPQD